MPAIGGKQPVGLTFRDVTGESGSMTVYANELTAVSLPGFLTAMGEFVSATEAICLGELAKTKWGEETIVSNSKPSDKSAQRESKLLVQYQGATTEKPYTLTIPTIDYSKLTFLTGAGDAVAFEVGNGAHADIVAWVTKFQALAKAPDDETEAVVVTGMRYVGRNS